MTRRHKRLLKRMKRKIRKLPEYRVWMTLVLKCHDRSCIVCKKNKNLQVHHIYRFSKIIMENNITSLRRAYRCKLLWDVSNGIALCQGCHKELHRSTAFERLVKEYLKLSN